MYTFINSQEDMDWLRDVHLPHLSRNVQSAILRGNEDSPTSITTYLKRNPLVTDHSVTWFRNG